MADLDLGWVAVSQHYFDLAVVMPDVLAVPKEGDPIRGGVFICNSETGHSRLWVSPFLFRNLCANGTILSGFANPLAGSVLDQRHAGRGGESLVADFRAAAKDALDLAPQAASLVETLVETQLGRRRFAALQERLRPILSKRRLTELLEDLHPKLSAYDGWNLVTARGQQYYGGPVARRRL